MIADIAALDRAVTRNRRIFIGVVLLLAILLLAACGSGADRQEIEDRQKQDQQSSQRESLEQTNLKRKIKTEEDPNRIGYVYILSTTGTPIGYYTVKGKISSNGSQLDPEDKIMEPLYHEYFVTDGPQDDGTYGEGDPGIFFFTTEGDMVVTNAVYFYSTQPIPSAIKLPQLG